MFRPIDMVSTRFASIALHEAGGSVDPFIGKNRTQHLKPTADKHYIGGVHMYFEFENLDVYQAALDFIEKVDQIVRQLPKGYAHRKKQLQRSADSIADNIAEGVGEFAADERRRFLRISRRSALEAASQILVIQRHKQANGTLLDQTLALLHRVVCMLTKMAEGAKDRRRS